jgi:hypothetical protein
MKIHKFNEEIKRPLGLYDLFNKLEDLDLSEREKLLLKIILKEDERIEELESRIRDLERKFRE